MSVHSAICFLTCNVMSHVRLDLAISCPLLLYHVCGTWSICCLTYNVIPHVIFTLSICLLLCCCPMNAACGPFVFSLVMPCPIWPSAVYCYVVAPCLWHSVHLLSYTCNAIPHVCFTLSNSYLLLYCRGMQSARCVIHCFPNCSIVFSGRASLIGLACSCCSSTLSSSVGRFRTIVPAKAPRILPNPGDIRMVKNLWARCHCRTTP